MRNAYEYTIGIELILIDFKQTFDQMRRSKQL